MKKRMSIIYKAVFISLCLAMTLALSACNKKRQKNATPPSPLTGDGTVAHPYAVNPKGGTVTVDGQSSANFMFTTDDEKGYTVGFTGDLDLHNRFGFNIVEPNKLVVSNAHTFYLVNKGDEPVKTTISFAEFTGGDTNVETLDASIGVEMAVYAEDFVVEHFKITVPQAGYYKFNTQIDPYYITVGTGYQYSLLGNIELKNNILPYREAIDPYTYYLNADTYYLDIAAEGIFTIEAASKPAPATYTTLTVDQKQENCEITSDGVYFAVTAPHDGYYAIILSDRSDESNYKINSPLNIYHILAGDTEFYKLISTSDTATCSVTAIEVPQLIAESGTVTPGNYAFVYQTEKTYLFTLDNGFEIRINSINWEPAHKNRLEDYGCAGEIKLITIDGTGTANLTVVEVDHDHD